MRARFLAAGASLLGSAGAAFAFSRFRHDLNAAKARLLAGSELTEIAQGPLEFASEGAGQAVLTIHGAGGGYDQGLMIARDIFRNGYRLIAPSRFGYLRTPVPADTSHSAQADAHAALLDRLDVPQAIVLGASAGAPSALELALRHPDRVTALVLLVPRCYHPETRVAVDATGPNKAIVALMERGADLAYWLALRTSRARLVRFLGVPPEVEAQAAKLDRAAVDEVLRSLLPLSQRVPGLKLDAAAEIVDLPLERIAVPTLIISARDDLYHTAPAAEYTASRIPESQLHLFESGGHLLVGRSGEVRELVDGFLRRRLWLRKAA